MPNERRRRKTLPNGRNAERHHLRLDVGLLDSAAWAALSPPAIKLLLAVWRKCNGRNNGTLVYSKRQAMTLLACGSDRARAAFDELQEKGFLALRRASSFSQKARAAREWAITAESEDGQPAERTFQRWQPTKKG
ncbi:MAG: hypothetical protein AB7P02_02645 [Alphaproteobacteria bacterium]